MRLLLPMRLCIAFRSATTPPVSRAVAATPRVPKNLSKTATAARPPKKNRCETVVAAASVLPTTELMQRQQLQLWELSKESREELDTKKVVQQAKDGLTRQDDLYRVVQMLSDANDFKSIEKILEGHTKHFLDKEMIPCVNLVNAVIWAAVFAKSLGSLSPSILDWMEKAVRRLPEPIPVKKESIIWLLSILRDDFPLLQQLQQESRSKNGRVGPEIYREKTVFHAALAYLEAGKKEEFRSLLESSGISILGGEELLEQQQPYVVLHHAMLRSIKKRDPAMLRWYAESLVANQRTPIPDVPQFAMMKPVISHLGGKIKPWDGINSDRRRYKLRKWRDDYDDAELDKLVHSMRDFMRHEMVVKKRGNLEDLNRLERMLTRLNSEGNRGRTVVVDWLNFTKYKDGKVRRNGEHLKFITDTFRTYSLIVVGRERLDEGDSVICCPKEAGRIKVLEVTPQEYRKFAGIQKNETDDLCALILAVATRGHLVTNDRKSMKELILTFSEFLERESRDVSQSILLLKYLNDAALRHDIAMIQPAVEYSRAVQWIDAEKKQLAFSVAHKPKHLPEYAPLRVFQWYILNID